MPAKPSSSTKIEGMITSISPMKAGKPCNYFDANDEAQPCIIVYPYQTVMYEDISKETKVQLL